MKKRTLKDLGLDPGHADYLVGHAHQMHGPIDFDNEVQKHLDWTPSDSQEQKRIQQSEALSNISEGSAPVIPGPKKDSFNPPIPGLPVPVPPPTMPSAPPTS